MEVSQVLASYWTQRQAQEAQAATLVRQALQLVLTPRTDLQRGEFAERAIGLAGAIQRKWTSEGVRAAVVAVTAGKLLQKHLKSWENAAFGALVGNLARGKKGNVVAAGRLRRTLAKKLACEASSVFRLLEVESMQDRWSRIEQKAARSIGKIAFSIGKLRAKRLKSAWERIQAPKSSAKALKLAKIGNRRNDRELWVAFKLLSKEVKGGYIPKCDFGLKLGQILSKLLAGRVKFARIGLWKAIACKRLGNFLSFKRSESLQKALKRFPLQPKPPLSRYVLYIIRGLRTFSGLSKPFIRLISAGKLAFRSLLKSPYFRLQLSIVLQTAAEKLHSKAHKFRLYHKSRAFVAIQAGGRGIRPCGRLLQALGRAYSGFLMGGKLATVRDMRRLKVKKQIKEAVEGEVAALMGEKNASKERQLDRLGALKQLKQRQIDANNTKKALILKRISTCILSKLVSKALQSRFLALQRAALSPAPVLTSKRFQSLFRRPLRLQLKLVLSALRTVHWVQSKAAGRLQGLVTVIVAKRGEVQAKALFRLFRFSHISANHKAGKGANRQLAALALFNGVRRKAKRAQWRAYIQLQLAMLRPRCVVKKVLPLLCLGRLLACRWIRIQAKFRKFALVTRKRRDLNLNSALNAIKRCGNDKKRKINWGKFAAKRLQSSLLRGLADIWRQIPTLAGKRQAGQRLYTALSRIRSRITVKVAGELINISKKQGKDQKLALNALFPTSNRVRKRIMLLNWYEKGKIQGKTGDFVTKFVQKMTRLLKTAKIARLTLSFSRIQAKSAHRKRLPICLNRLMSRKRLVAKAAAWARLRCSRRVLATTSVQQLVAALHIAKKLVRLRSRFQRISERFPFQRFKHYLAKRRAAKGLFVGLRRCLLMAQRENMDWIRASELGLGRQKRALYGLFRVLMELPDRIKTSHLATTLHNLSTKVSKHRAIATALSRLLQSFKAGMQRTALLTAVSKWKGRVPLPVSLPVRLQSIVAALSRCASYRLSFQAFECIYTKSLGKENDHALLLCRKVVHRADSRRTVRGFR